MKCKYNNTLLFKIILVHTCTYNNSVKSNTHKCILFDLTDQDNLNNFGPIKVLLAPPGRKYVQYDPDEKKQSYFDKIFVETTFTFNTKDKIYNFLHNMQRQQKQYGIKNDVSGKIYSDMVDTLPSVATS